MTEPQQEAVAAGGLSARSHDVGGCRGKVCLEDRWLQDGALVTCAKCGAHGEVLVDDGGYDLCWERDLG